MIRAWLDLPAFGIFATLCILYYGMAFVLVGLACHSRLGAPIRSVGGLVAPFFGSVALLFGLLTGFLASDVGDRNRQAVRAVQTEAGELRNIYTLSVASASDMAEIRVALKAYVNSEVHDEWPAIMNGETSPRTDAAYDNLLREISDPTVMAVFRLAIGEAVRVPEIARTLDSVGRAASRDALIEMMANARAHGLVDGDPAEMAEQFGALLWGNLMVGLLLGVAERPSPREMARRARNAAAAFLALHPQPERPAA